MILSNAVGAQVKEIDRIEVWINVFSEPAFTIDRVEEVWSTSSTGINFGQTISGRLGSAQVRFNIQRPGAGETFGEGQIYSLVGSAQQLRDYFKLSDVTNHRRINGTDGLGGSVYFQAGKCRAAVIPLKADCRVEGFGRAVAAVACDQLDRFTAYLERMKISTRDRNVADLAIARSPPVSSAPSVEKPAKQLACEQAKGNNERMATFMQSLVRDDLAGFLARSQDCATFGSN